MYTSSFFVAIPNIRRHFWH